MQRRFDIGSRVVYSARFLRSIGISATALEWQAKGTIVGITDGWLATVDFDNLGVKTINIGNRLPVNRTVTQEESPFECGDAWNGLGFRPLL